MRKWRPTEPELIEPGDEISDDELEKVLRELREKLEKQFNDFFERKP